MGKKRLAAMGAAVLITLSWGGGVTAVPAGGGAEIPAEEPKYVALTFDDGPRSDTTTRLLDGLLTRGASATFFLVGEQIAGNEDLVRRMRDEGHQVGNHSWSHMMLKGQSNAVVDREIGKTDALLKEVLGDGTYWVRPPYGLLNESQKKRFTVPLVHWSVDPEDWKLRDTAKDVQAVLKKVHAALEIVDTLQAQGYTFVTVEELLRLYDVTPQPGVFYLSATEHH